MGKLIRRPDIWISLALFLLMIPAERLELFSSLENWLLGNRHIIRLNTLDPEKTQFAYDDIVIVDTEEKFFDEYGSWPLKRSDIAKLTSNIKKLGAKVIALDMLMDFPNGYDEDPILAEAMEKTGNTIVVAQLEFDGGGKFKGINYPTETLKGAAESGYTNHTLIGDKLSRVRFFPEQIKEHNVWPFAIKTLAMYKGVEPKLENGQLIIGDIVVPLDQFNDLWIDFPLLPPMATFLAKDTPAGISAAEILLELEDVPDIEANRDDYDLLSWDMQPGDILIFHPLIVHGSGGNQSMTRHRRALASRWVGEDVVYDPRPHTMPLPPDHGLEAGERLHGHLFPTVLGSDNQV